MQYTVFSKLRLLPGFRGRPYLRILWFDKTDMCCGKNVIWSNDFKSRPPRMNIDITFNGVITAPKGSVRGVAENFVQWNCVQADKTGTFCVTVPASLSELAPGTLDTPLDQWVKSDSHLQLSM